MGGLEVPRQRMRNRPAVRARLYLRTYEPLRYSVDSPLSHPGNAGGRRAMRMVSPQRGAGVSARAALPRWVLWPPLRSEPAPSLPGWVRLPRLEWGVQLPSILPPQRLLAGTSVRPDRGRFLGLRYRSRERL